MNQGPKCSARRRQGAGPANQIRGSGSTASVPTGRGPRIDGPAQAALLTGCHGVCVGGGAWLWVRRPGAGGAWLWVHRPGAGARGARASALRAPQGWVQNARMEVCCSERQHAEGRAPGSAHAAPNQQEGGGGDYAGNGVSLGVGEAWLGRLEPPHPPLLSPSRPEGPAHHVAPTLPPNTGPQRAGCSRLGPGLRRPPWDEGGGPGVLAPGQTLSRVEVCIRPVTCPHTGRRRATAER